MQGIDDRRLARLAARHYDQEGQRIMELTFPGPPPPAQMAGALAVVMTFGTGAILLAGRLRRATRSRVMVVPAYLMFVPSAVVLLMIGLSLVYPHHHHDTRWTGRADTDDFIDAAIGLAFWAVFVP